MSGRWKIKHEDMRRLALEARDVCAGSSGRAAPCASSGSPASRTRPPTRCPTSRWTATRCAPAPSLDEPRQPEPEDGAGRSRRPWHPDPHLLRLASPTSPPRSSRRARWGRRRTIAGASRPPRGAGTPGGSTRDLVAGRARETGRPSRGPRRRGRGRRGLGRAVFGDWDGRAPTSSDGGRAEAAPERRSGMPVRRRGDGRRVVWDRVVAAVATTVVVWQADLAASSRTCSDAPTTAFWRLAAAPGSLAGGRGVGRRHGVGRFHESDLRRPRRAGPRAYPIVA